MEDKLPQKEKDTVEKFSHYTGKFHRRDVWKR